MAIHQVNATYMRAEDRIQLRVTMTEGDEFRFWLTRAVMRDFSPQAAAWISPPSPSPASVQQAFKREAAAAQADFATPMKTGETFPLGEPPVLVMSMRIESQGTAAANLLLHLPDKRLVTLHLDENALAGIQRLLQQATAAADWGLPAILTTGSAAGKVH